LAALSNKGRRGHFSTSEPSAGSYCHRRELDTVLISKIVHAIYVATNLCGFFLLALFMHSLHVLRGVKSFKHYYE
jgi:hypothetical protein